MKPLVFSPTFEKKILHIKKRNPLLFAHIHQTLKLFLQTPNHPSLRLHKLQGNMKNVWSISVTDDFRLVFIQDNEYYFFDAGTHAQVYRRSS